MCEHDVTLPLARVLNGLFPRPHLLCYCVVGKLLRGDTFANFKVLWLFVKVFFTTFRAMVSFGGASEESAKVSPRKFYFPPIRESFFHESFPLYGMQAAKAVVRSESDTHKHWQTFFCLSTYPKYVTTHVCTHTIHTCT